MPLDASQSLRNLKAAKEPIGFAFGAGGSGSPGVLLAEKGKSGDQLAAMVKKEPGVKQVCGGSAVWNGSGAVLYCERPLPGLPKLVEGWAKANKAAIRCTLEAGKPPAEDERDEEDEGEEQDDIFTPPALLKRLKQAKAKPVFFGFGIGAKGPDLLTLHPTREGKKLFQLVRQANGATKGAFGTVTVDGTTATFHCEAKPLPGMKRLLKEMFKEGKLPFKPEVLGPEGEADEEDEVEGEETPTASDAKPDKAIAQARAELAQLLPSLKNRFNAAPSEAAEIRALYRECEAAIREGDAAQARKLLDRLTELADEGEAADSGIAKMRAELKALLPALKVVVRQGGEHEKTVRDTWKEAETAFDKGDVPAGEKAMALLRDLAVHAGDLRAADENEAEGEEGGGAKAKGPPNYARLALDWERTRTVALADLQALKQALNRDLRDGPRAAILPDVLKKIDVVADLYGDALTRALRQAAAGKDAEEQAKRGRACSALVAKLAAQTRRNPMIDQIDRNPAVRMTMKKTLLDALKTLDAALP